MNIEGKVKRSSVIKELLKLAVWITLLTLVSILIYQLITKILLTFYGIDITNYETYINTGLTLIFGYLIITSISNITYHILTPKYGHAAAASVKSLFKIFGVGALISGLAGLTAGGAAGVALGGFIGMVVGFAARDILGQVLCGFFLLVARPFKIGDEVDIAGDHGLVIDITTLFTIIKKDDGSIVLIPNNRVMGQKIIIKKLLKNRYST